MARYTDAVCRLCRRAGKKLFLKGERCYTPKCAVERRRRPPGPVSAKRRRLSDWGIRLREKQNARAVYGILERQFEGYFTEARRAPGVTGVRLMAILETRLDNIIYRLGYGKSRAQARQWVLHGHFTVEGKVVSIPSAHVKIGQVVGWKPSVKSSEFYQDAVKTLGQRAVPEWLSFDKADMKATVTRLPDATDMDDLIDTRLIVEHYSR